MTQSPRVRVLAAGHSAASRQLLAGRADDGKTVHSKHWGTKAAATAVQAATLRPATAAMPALAGGPFEIEAEGPWFSPPLRDLPALAETEIFTGDPAETNRPRHETLVDEDGILFGTRAEPIFDPLVAAARPPAGLATPAPLFTFEGVGNVQGYYPPDIEGAVGPNHYVQVVNVSYGIFDKSGAPLGGPWPTNSLWAAGAPGTACATHNDGDAIFNYDQFADRWMLTQFAVNPGQIVCFAISQTPDPLGAYYLYQITTPRFPDYFKIGIWPDPANNAYFMATNSGYQGQYDVFAVDRESMLAGSPVRPTQYFQNYPNLWMPADVDGSTPPPPGTPGFFYSFRKGGESYFGNPPSDSLDLWAFQVNWTTPASSTFSQVVSFTPASGGLAPFNWTVCGFFSQNCLPQPGTTVKIDSASWWPMQRLAYRNFGGHESMVGTWTVDVTGSPDLAAPRWFELRRSGGGPWAIHQQGTHSPDNTHRWMGSIAMDRDGNIALGYSVVNAATNLYPSIRYATRAVNDPLGTLQPEQTLVTGTGAQTGTAGRWGDYSSMTVDPADDCTFWYTNEYLTTTGGAPWQTRVGVFRIPGCGGLQIAPTSQSLCASAGSASFAITLFQQFQGTTNLGVAGCPANATCGFTVNPVVFPATQSALEVTNLGAVPAGSYALTVTATDAGDPANTRDVPLALAVWESIAGVPALTFPAAGATNVAVRPAFAWQPVAGAETYELEIDDDPTFATPIYTRTVAETGHTPVSDLPSNSVLFWRVRAINPCGDGAFAAASSFTTVPLPGDCPLGAQAVAVYSYGFEAGAAGWTTPSGVGTNTWAIVTTNPYDGANHYRGAGTASVTDQRLVSPAVAVPSGQDPVVLRFWHAPNLETSGTTECWDGGILEVSTDAGATWTQVPNADLLLGGYERTIRTSTNPLGGLPGWCGPNPSPYQQTIADLSAYAGQSVQLRWRIGTDGSVSRPGWDVDAVVVQACTSAGIFSDGFEVGSAASWSGAYGAL
ncbi:MAG: immune inhibitor A [Thermoanaerobaculia bacterium]|nr:immune inhibitor A [Thermoanaerobaculia bacterium]